jgi:hypothetical protein
LLILINVHGQQFAKRADKKMKKKINPIGLE